LIETLLAEPQQPVSEARLLHPLPVKQSSRIAIASTFAAEPLESPLAFWMQELGMPFSIEIAPFNQILQQLLDPTSLFLSDRDGVNLFAPMKLAVWKENGRHEESFPRKTTLNGR
jgi:hypothetical protein